MVDDEASDARDVPDEARSPDPASQDPASGDPRPSKATPTSDAPLEDPPPREGERPETRSEEAKGPLAPSEDLLEQWSRDELLERAAELGIDVDPTIDRRALIDKLSKDAEAARLTERAASTQPREGSGGA